jgi:hypothetical protein
MPNRNKRTDLTASDALGYVDQLQSAGHHLEVDVTDGLLNFAAMDGKCHNLLVDFTNVNDVKVTSHIGNDIIEHPTLRAGIHTFIANVVDKNPKGIN